MSLFFFFPTLPKMSGGMAVIARLARLLHDAGRDTILVMREPYPRLSEAAPGVRQLLWNDLSLTENDIWVVPEGFPAALLPGLQKGARCVVYVQSWSYLHGELPEGTRWNQLPVTFIAVSDPVAWFIHETTGKIAPVLRPGIDTTLFSPPDRNMGASLRTNEPIRANEPIRIAWMPRKNRVFARQIREIYEARNTEPAIWIEIHDRTQSEVAQMLQHAHVFLATGFPEGCPLPPLEALACGCLVAGFGGFGGWDYMRQAMPGGFQPWWPIRDVLWGGNGFYAADADSFAAVLALEQAANLLRSGGPELANIRDAAASTIAEYTVERQRDAAICLFDRFLSGDSSATEHNND